MVVCGGVVVVVVGIGVVFVVIGGSRVVDGVGRIVVIVVVAGVVVVVVFLLDSKSRKVGPLTQSKQLVNSPQKVGEPVAVAVLPAQVLALCW